MPEENVELVRRGIEAANRRPKPDFATINELYHPDHEFISRALLAPAAREVAASRPAQRQRRRYELPPPGSPQTHRRDALIVSLIAYAGLRPGELRALQFQDGRENTILVERAANPDGSVKATETGRRRAVRLLPPLARDLAEYRLALGRPPEQSLIILGATGGAWTKTDWENWADRQWAPACRAAGLDTVPRPYDLRHSFVSLLLAEGRPPLWVAQQAGHSVATLLSTYAHLIDEYADRERIDPEREIASARAAS